MPLRDVSRVLELHTALTGIGSVAEIHAGGPGIVHGADEGLGRIQDCIEFAPLHNHSALSFPRDIAPVPGASFTNRI